MEAIILIGAIVLLTLLGMRLIHRINARHDARIASHTFSDPMPGVGRRSRKHHRRVPEDRSGPADPR
ncbi:hypothetical protein ACFC18_06460 [Streptomyces sp. NPDC056121]|uniref:hypothetical protein n=1 Tax=unclassified Streptomyces TaxID=2593676 RepID=UPI0022570E7F|nr:hypothetical protein [Streptomyces sp. NBC_00401]MCX5082670.1 hypothetical protein [Streptomyces sp. NBC_00401]